MGQKNSKNKGLTINTHTPTSPTPSPRLLRTPGHHNSTPSSPTNHNQVQPNQQSALYSQQCFLFPLFGSRIHINGFTDQSFIFPGSQHLYHLYFAQYDHGTDPSRYFPDYRINPKNTPLKDPTMLTQAYKVSITKEQFLNQFLLSNSPHDFYTNDELKIDKKKEIELNPELVFDFQCVSLPDYYDDSAHNGDIDIGTRYYSYNPSPDFSNDNNAQEDRWIPPIMDILDPFRHFIGTQFQQSYWDDAIISGSILSSLTKASTIDLYRYHNFENMNLPFIPFVSIFLDVNSANNLIWFELWLKQRLEEINSDCVVQIFAKPIHIFLFNHDNADGIPSTSSLEHSVGIETTTNDTNTPDETSKTSQTPPKKTHQLPIFTHHDVLKLCSRYHIPTSQVILHSFPPGFDNYPKFVQLFDKLVLHAALSLFHSDPPHPTYTALCHSFNTYPCNSALTEPVLHRELILPPRAPPPFLFIHNNDGAQKSDFGTIPYIQPLIQSVPRLPYTNEEIQNNNFRNNNQQPNHHTKNQVPTNLTFQVPLSFYFPSAEIYTDNTENSSYSNDDGNDIGQIMSHVMDVLTDVQFGVSPSPMQSCTHSHFDSALTALTQDVGYIDIEYGTQFQVQFPPTKEDIELLASHPRFYQDPYPELITDLDMKGNNLSNFTQNGKIEHNENKNKNEGNVNFHQIELKFLPTKEHNLLPSLCPFGQLYSIYIIDCSKLRNLAQVKSLNNVNKIINGELLYSLLPNELLRHLRHAHCSLHIFLLTDLSTAPPSILPQQSNMLLHALPSFLTMTSITATSFLSSSSSSSSSSMIQRNSTQSNNINTELSPLLIHRSLKNNGNNNHNNNNNNSTTLLQIQESLVIQQDSIVTPLQTIDLDRLPNHTSNLSNHSNYSPSPRNSNNQYVEQDNSFVGGSTAGLVSLPKNENRVTTLEQARLTFLTNNSSSIFTSTNALFSAEVFKDAIQCLIQNGNIKNKQEKNVIFHETTLYELRNLIKNISNDEMLHRMNQYYSIMIHDQGDKK
jgi:hypothetical protein